MASTFLCPKGHASVDNDFCSECGAKIQGASGPSGAQANGSEPVCPDCGAPVPSAGVNFCEICGYNFVTRSSGQFSVGPAVTPVSPTPAPAPPTPAAVPPVAAPTPPRSPDVTPVTATVASPAVASLRLVITVDPSLRDSNSPEAPVDSEPIIYPLERPVNLVGRKSDSRAIYPEIALDSDTAISHRHGIISKLPDGSVIYRDLESSNGTRLNGADITPLADTPLRVGDQLTLGHWTRISVEAKE